MREHFSGCSRARLLVRTKRFELRDGRIVRARASNSSRRCCRRCCRCSLAQSAPTTLCQEGEPRAFCCRRHRCGRRRALLTPAGAAQIVRSAAAKSSLATVSDGRCVTFDLRREETRRAAAVSNLISQLLDVAKARAQRHAGGKTRVNKRKIANDKRANQGGDPKICAYVGGCIFWVECERSKSNI